MADEDKRKVEIETQQAVNISIAVKTEAWSQKFFQSGDKEKESQEDEGPQCPKEGIIWLLLVF